MQTIKIACQGAGHLPISELEPFQGELKSLSKENYERFKSELLELGFSEPISVWKHKNKNYILNGHQRLRTLTQMQKEGYKIPQLPVSWIEADNFKQAKKKVLALASQFGEIEEQGLYQFMHEAELTMEDVTKSFNFPEVDFDKFRAQFFDNIGADGLTDDDQIPEAPKVPKTKRGDIYKLGKHRLMCGDSTSETDVAKLMQDEKADLWLTDPPYGVSYKSIGAPDKHRDIENDAHSLEEMSEFWFKVAELAHRFSSNAAAYYWFACQGGDQMMMMMSISRAKWKVRHELIWAKDQMVFGRCDYHYKHEPILYGWKKDGKHQWCSDRTQTSLLQFARPKSSDLHPTMKPVELVEYLMGNNTKAGQIVLDTFGGSGTTMIAAEKIGRASRLIEIDPIYCDVIVKRWEEFTGQKAELIRAKTKLKKAAKKPCRSASATL